MTIPHDRWRASLEGHRFDIEALAEELSREVRWTQYGTDPKPHPFLSLIGAIKASGHMDGRAQARAFLNDANTSLAIAIPSYQPVHLGPYFEELSATGESLGISATIEPQTAFVRARAGKVHITVNGHAPVRVPSLTERILETREKDDDFDAACAVFGSAGDDYRLLYVALEYIRNSVKPDGDNRKKWEALAATGWVEPERLKHFKTTAHTYRHALPKLPQELEIREAKEMLRELIRALVKERTGTAD